MHFWSEGLGDSELVIDLGRAKVDLKDDCVALTGIVDSPAPWEYEVKIQFADWEKILDTATSRETSGYVAAHMRFPELASMGWSIGKFIVLLAFYRFSRALHVARLTPATGNALEEHGTGKA